MNHAYPTRRLNLTVDDRAAWDRYEAKNAAAREQYAVLPISLNQAGPAYPCGTCGRPTKAKYGVCKPCREAAA